MRSPLTIPARFWRLPPRDRLQVLRAAGWLVAARVLLRVLPFRTIERMVARLPARRAPAVRLQPEDCAVAIARAASVLPASRCLARAIAAACLLRRDGRRFVLQLGVRRDAGGSFYAHSWVESDGVAVTGGDEADGFAVLRGSRRP